MTGPMDGVKVVEMGVWIAGKGGIVSGPSGGRCGTRRGADTLPEKGGGEVARDVGQ